MLFCGSDVARALGYSRPNDAVSAHAKGTVKRRTLTNGGEQEMAFIPESDLYRLIFRSKLPSAERFTDWVTTEVLPSIRKNGGYIAQQETLSPEELMVNGCNMTVHRDYANKACPGQYLYDRHGAIAAAVNEILGSGTTQAPEAAPEPVQGFPATPFTVRVIIPDLNYRKGPGMSYAVRGQTGKGVFTITEVQDGWGKLKSGAGWIYLENESYCTIVGGSTQAEAWTPAVGDIVNFTGSRHYASANAAKGSACTGGRAKITRIYKPDKSKHPYHLVRVSGSGSTVYGWVDAGTFTKA